MKPIILLLLLSSCCTLRNVPNEMILIGANYRVYDQDTVTKCRVLARSGIPIVRLDSIVYFGYIPMNDTVLVKKIRDIDKSVYIITKTIKR